VALIENDEPQDVGSHLEASLDYQGQKEVFLPLDGNYRVVLDAINAGVVSIAINEFCFVLEAYTRIVNWYDISVVMEDELVLSIPAFSFDDDGIEEDTAIVYYLRIADNLLRPDLDVRGTYAVAATFEIDIINEDLEVGIALGGGRFAAGSFVQLEAFSNEEVEATFLGWYEDDTLISTDYSYRFRAERNMTLHAIFTTPQVVEEVNIENDTETIIEEDVETNIEYIPDSPTEYNANNEGGPRMTIIIEGRELIIFSLIVGAAVALILTAGITALVVSIKRRIRRRREGRDNSAPTSAPQPAPPSAPQPAHPAVHTPPYSPGTVVARDKVVDNDATEFLE
jgi:hypothetical protein